MTYYLSFHLRLVVLCSFAVVPAVAQQNSKSTDSHVNPPQANYAQAARFSKKRMSNVNYDDNTSYFIKNSDYIAYSRLTRNIRTYYLIDPFHKKRIELLNSEQASAQSRQLANRNGQNLQVTVNLLGTDLKRNTADLKIADSFYHYNFRTKVFTSFIPQKPANVSQKPFNLIEARGKYSPDSSYLVFVKNYNLYGKKTNAPDSTAVQLTNDGVAGFSYGIGEESPGINSTKAIWFKDAKKLYVVRTDSRKIGKITLINSLTNGRPALVEEPYIMAGDKEVYQYELDVIDIARKTVTKINTNRWKDQTLTAPYADESSEKLYFQRENRPKNEIELCSYDLKSARTTVIIHEVSKPIFNQERYHLSFHNHGKEILWYSERSGWGHYYLYDTRGHLKNAITSGNWVAGNILYLDSTKRTLYFNGHGREKGISSNYTFIYKVNLDGRHLTLLTPEDANHQIVFSSSHRFFIDNFSRIDLAPTHVMRSSDGTKIQDLGQANLNKLYALGWKMPQRFTVKAADGETDLFGEMWKPYDFDSTKTYPVISHVYPGPTTEEMSVKFTTTGDLNAELAQLGFIVINMGHRGGSPVRSKAYHTFGFGNLRDYALADDRYGIEQLARRYSFIDTSRVGIFGHSGGGFMATAAICTYPDFYKAAVAASGNHDNHIFYMQFAENYNGIQEDSAASHPEAFKFSVGTNQELASRLKGHLLLVTGDLDRTVIPSNTYRMADALINAGKNFELVVLPGESHIYKGAADDFYQQKLLNHFAKYLLNDFSSEKSADYSMHN